MVARSFRGAELTETFGSRLKFVLPPLEGCGPAFLFREMEAQKAEAGIQSYTISQPTLEQIFLDISSEQVPEQGDEPQQIMNINAPLPTI